MDDTLSIMEEMLLVMSLMNAKVDHPYIGKQLKTLIDRIHDIRNQQEQDCLQEAEDMYREFPCLG